MKMLMSADSSDCRVNSNDRQSPSQSPKQPVPSTAASNVTVVMVANSTNKTSVICVNNNNETSNNINKPDVASALCSSTNEEQEHHTTPAPPLPPPIMVTLQTGLSHLENALKLPPNTSVSNFYQNSKMPAIQSASQPSSSASSTSPAPCVIFQAPKDYRSKSLQTLDHQSSTSNCANGAASSTSTPHDMESHTPANGVVVSTSGSLCTATTAATAARKIPHSNVIYINKTTCNINNNTVVVQNAVAPLNTLSNAASTSSSESSSSSISVVAAENSFFSPQNGVVSTSATCIDLPPAIAYADASYPSPLSLPLASQHTQQIQLYQQHIMATSSFGGSGTPHNRNSHYNKEPFIYHHHHANDAGNIVVVAADSRPQTPDYIKSYPVMDTTVASSVKGEPELNIEFDGTTVLCRVCGDKASGFHYGVHSCEGCKGFFRRSIQQKIQYRPCTKNQQCSILRINRNRCQYCRLKKCIAVGMSRDAVRFGRVPKREKARILAAMQQSTQNRGQQRALATELDDQPRLLAAVLRAHLETCEFTKEKVATMRQRARECPSYSMPTLLACPLNPAPELQSEQEFSQRFAHVIRGVIDFAGMIPGFQLLTQDDKFTLLKAGLFDALFVRLICMFDSSINSIICLNGQVMRRDAIQNGANARFLVDSTFNFAERMNSMNLSDAEIGLFCAIVLITPDRPGLRNIELIEKMYSRLKGCLQTIISQNHPDQPDFMSKLLDTMPDLRTLSTLHTEKLVVFRTEHKELLRQQMWTMEDEQLVASAKSPSSSSVVSVGVCNWDDTRMMDVEAAKSPLGSVSSTESGEMEYTSSSTSLTAVTAHQQHTNDHHHLLHQNQNSALSSSVTHHPHQLQQQPSSLASSAPLLAATLSGTCPLRNRANSGSSGDSVADLDMVVGSHAHLTQNGLTITPIVRSHTHSRHHQQLHHHLTSAAAAAAVNPNPHHRYRKLDSPTDSGIESGNEKNECGKPASSGGSSSCSSPRSSVDDALDCSDAGAGSSGTTGSIQAVTVSVSVSSVRSSQTAGNGVSSAAPSSTSSKSTIAVNSTCALKRQIIEDMPVLKRVLQAPPLYDTNSLMDEAYKPHKKFRALRHREFETAEADASSTTVGANLAAAPAIFTTTNIAAANPVQSSSQNINTAISSPPAASAVTVPQALISSNASTSPQPQQVITSAQQHPHQSQLHMHLTRSTPTNGSSIQQQTSSSLSSTHSVLAKSLMAEPRMTPEQMKRSDIIQNYIMRESPPASSTTNSNANNCLMVHTPNGPGSRSPAPVGVNVHQIYHHQSHLLHHQSQHSSNSNCASPSTTMVTLASPPPPASGTTAARWPGHSVITTTSVNQRQPSVSPSSNGSTSSSNSTTSLSSALSLSLSSPVSASSSSSATSTTGVGSSTSSAASSTCQYFQSPHSTSASVSPARPTSSSVMHSPPRLLELQVDIADSQQPLNLSKKSPTPPPTKLQALVAAATAAQRYPTNVSADVTVTATAAPGGGLSGNTSQAGPVGAGVAGAAQSAQVHKVLLEA